MSAYSIVVVVSPCSVATVLPTKSSGEVTLASFQNLGVLGAAFRATILEIRCKQKAKATFYTPPDKLGGSKSATAVCLVMV
jgi:hypothetical protein